MIMLQRNGFDEYRYLVEAKDLEASRFGDTPHGLLKMIVEHRVQGVKKIEFNSGLMVVTINPKVKLGGKYVKRGPLACENRIKSALEI